MIALKTWNSFPQYKRDKAVKALFYNMPDWYQDDMAKEWHHKLDAEHKIILESIYERKDSRGKAYYVVRSEQVL